MSDGKRGDDAHATASVTVGAFLRALAQRADDDPALAAHLQAALFESGLVRALTDQPPAQREAAPASGARGGRARASARASGDATDEAPPDPFTVYRAHGEERLRATLDALELAALRTIVRAHRLDPARISARWTARERVISLIVDQVKARANHGRAFERV